MIDRLRESFPSYLRNYRMCLPSSRVPFGNYILRRDKSDRLAEDLHQTEKGIVPTGKVNSGQANSKWRANYAFRDTKLQVSGH